MAPLGPVYQAGTLSGNPLATAAGLAALALLDDAAYARIAATAARLGAGFESALRDAGLVARAPVEGTLVGLFMGDEPPVDYDGARSILASDTGGHPVGIYKTLVDDVILASWGVFGPLVTATELFIGITLILGVITPIAALVAFAARAGAETLWTGHYARIAERDGLRLVARGVDPQKDQSYMLAMVDPALLARVAFPLGTMTKPEVRAEAAAAGLDVAGRVESQEACFLAGGDYRTFLTRHGVADSPGPIVDESGAVVGQHDGVWRFTPGQRRGLRVVSPEPVYALRADVRSSTLVVGPRRSLAARRVDVRGRLYADADGVDAKLRYRSAPVRARVDETAEGFSLELVEPAEAVAPGQVAVLYDDDVVVGAGVIERATG